MKEYQVIRDTSPLSLKVLNDQLRFLWWRVKNITDKDIRNISANKIEGAIKTKLIQVGYSNNRLKNPSAETGDLSEWVSNNVDVVQGGMDGQYCFKMGTIAQLEQTHITRTYAEDYKVVVYVLPEEDGEPNFTIEITYEYSDGSAESKAVKLNG